MQQLKEKCDNQLEELTTVRQMHDELSSKQQTMQKENEFLKSRVEMAA